MLIVVCVPFTTWWAVGDLSTTTDHPDHLLRPIPLTSAQESSIGWSATVLLGLSILVLVGLHRSGRRVDRTQLLVVAPLLALGLFLGVGYRIMTAGVVGANIGGGGVILTGFVCVPAMIVLSVWAAVRASRSARSSNAVS